MKRFLIASILCAVIVGVASAAPTVTVGRLAGTYPEAPALSGEFMLTPNDELAAVLGSGDPFQSFCVEAYELITVGGVYEAILNDEAIMGGWRRPGEAAGPDGGDLISPETAYLYTQFRAGALDGYEFTPGPDRAVSARNLQVAIWHLEGEAGYQDLGMFPSEVQDFVTAAQEAVEEGGWNTVGRVRVLNLYETLNGKVFRQDMLVLVPAPGALLLGSLGLGFVGWLRRRAVL